MVLSTPHYKVVQAKAEIVAEKIIDSLQDTPFSKIDSSGKCYCGSVIFSIVYEEMWELIESHSTK